MTLPYETGLPPVRITDYAIEAIADTIGTQPAETGGALLGPPHADYITDFLFDPAAETTTVRYSNSAELLDAITVAETTRAARFKGIIHSHPVVMPVPSAQDEHEYAQTLGLTPTLTRYLAPIVTHDTTTEPEPHELVYGPMRISFYGVTAVAGHAAIAPMRPIVVPIAAAMAAAGITAVREPIPVDVDGSVHLVATADIPSIGGVGRATIAFGPDFPATAPVIIPDGAETAIPLSWHLPISPAARLDAAIRTATAPVRAGSPDPPGPALFARTTGLVSNTLTDATVLIAGLGSVGSYLADNLARAGVGTFILIDADAVEVANIGRSNYRVNDIGEPKTTAATTLIASINPDAKVEAHAVDLTAMPGPDLAALVSRASLVIAATDDPGAQALLGHHAHHAGRPAVFPGLYRGASGGEIVITTPETCCLTCATGGIRTAELDGPHPATDYGTGRLIAEPGLLADIHHVTTVAAKIALGLLHCPDDEAATARFTRGIIEAGHTYAVFSTEPDYWILGELLSHLPGQYSHQAMWLTPTARPECPVCGKPENRTDPAEHTSPDLARLRTLAKGSLK